MNSSVITLKNRLGDFENLIAAVLEKVRERGIADAEVSIRLAAGYSVTVLQGDIDQLEHDQSQVMELTVYESGKTGSASATDFREASLKIMIDKACQIARFTQSDPYAGLVDPTYVSKSFPALSIYYPWSLEVVDAIALAKSCESAGMALDARITCSEGASVSNHSYGVAYGNSHGFIGSYATTRHSLGCVLIAQQTSDKVRDYAYTVACDANDLLDSDKLAKQAANWTVKRLGARSLSTRHCPVIMQARVARELFGYFMAAINGRSLYRKASFLVDCLDKQIFPDWLTISEQPHLSKGLGSAPFDVDGVVTRSRDIVKKGKLNGYVLSAYSARRLGMEPTGNGGGVHNIRVTHKACDFEALLSQMGTGLLVTELMGSGLNLATGDYSEGAFGYWIEGGEVQYPVHEVTIAANLKSVFQGIQSISCDVDVNGGIHTGSVLIDNMTVGGLSGQ